MIVFVKDFATYRTIKHASTVSHSLVLDSLSSEKSSVIVSGSDIDISDIRNWLIADGYVYQITNVTTNAGQTTVNLIHPLDVFSRPLELHDQPLDQTVGGFVAAQLKMHWVNADDPMYAIPYLIVSNLDTIPFVAPELDSRGLYSLSEYCRAMRKSYQLTVHFSNANHSLICTISKSSVLARNVSFEDGHSLLKSATAATVGYAKLTVLHDISTGEKDSEGNPIYARERTEWYLAEDGTVSIIEPARRAAGEWNVLHLKNCPNVSEKVIEAFSKNRAGGKLEFLSDLELDVNTACTFFVQNKILKSYISSKKKDSSNKRYFYKAGEFATTLTEKVKGVTK